MTVDPCGPLYLLCVHALTSLRLRRLRAHHGGPDSNGGLGVGWGKGHAAIVLLTTPHACPKADGNGAGAVGTTWVEAVLTWARFPHVFCKLTTRRHLPRQWGLPPGQCAADPDKMRQGSFDIMPSVADFGFGQILWFQGSPAKRQY